MTSTLTCGYPEIYAGFTIRGLGLDLPGITATLGLQPSSTRKAGSRWKDPPRPQVDIWALDGHRERTLDGAAAIETLVGLLEPAQEKMWQVRATYPEAAFDLTLVVYLSSPSCLFPDVTLANELLARMARLGLRFSVSTYAVEE